MRRNDVKKWSVGSARTPILNLTHRRSSPNQRFGKRSALEGTEGLTERLMRSPCRPGQNGQQLGTIPAINTHSIVEAKNDLSELIDRALAGEGVVITRHGRPVVELRPVAQPARNLTPDDLDWLAGRRPGGHPVAEDAGALLLSRLRDAIAAEDAIRALGDAIGRRPR